MEQRQYHAADDIDVLSAYHTTVGYHERCRRCGSVLRTNRPGRWGPCIPVPAPEAQTGDER